MRLLVLLTAAAFSFSSCQFNKNTIRPASRNLVQVVYASGKIYAVNHIHVSAKTNAYITKILVKEGDVVKTGTPLAVLQSDNVDVNMDIAKTNITLSEQFNRPDANQLNAAWRDVEAAQSKYQLDSANYERYKNLWKEDITAKINLDQAKTQADVSAQAYKKALSTYDNLKTKLNTDVTLAKKQLQLQQATKKDYIITAPSDGKVYAVIVKEGQLVTTGTTLIEFGNAQGFEAELDVDEEDIGMVQLHQPVILNTDAYPNTPLNTTVREIQPSVTVGNKTTLIKADVDADTLKLYNGMSVEANIIIQKKQNVLTVPVEYVTADSYVVLKKDKKKIPVKTGIRDMRFIEILSGIDSTSELIKP
ncbi:MAG: efflux RND transporter periplasmic adaptor subunit [Bacteroidota bacterium]|nr:efflux RND transporter periplasmic adaptor subunit [Bacteroidota bacterium]